MSRRQLRIGSSTEVSGRFEASGDLVLAGTVTGELDVKGRLHVLAGARIAGPLRCAALQLDGLIEGDVIAIRRARIGRSGCLRGRLNTARVEFDDGARYSGELHLQLESSPAKPAPVRRSPGEKGERRLSERLVSILPMAAEDIPAVALEQPPCVEIAAGAEPGGSSE